jgi:hypothetical protein
MLTDSKLGTSSRTDGFAIFDFTDEWLSMFTDCGRYETSSLTDRLIADPHVCGWMDEYRKGPDAKKKADRWDN